MPTPILTTANQLTILRMALAPVLVVLILWHEFTWAVVVFIVAALTDLFDGLIARLGHQRTKLGAMLDPVADKIFMSCCYVVLTWSSGLHAKIPAWLTVTTLSRDGMILVGVVIVNLTIGRRIFQPSLLGKCSAVSQVLSAGVVVLLNALGKSAASVLPLFQLTLLLIVASALHYVYLASAKRPHEERDQLE